MKLWTRTIFCLVLFAFTHLSWAENGLPSARNQDLTAEELEEMQVAVRVESILIRSGLQVAQDLNGAQPQEELAGQHLLDMADQIVAQYETSTPRPRWERMRDGLRAFRWRALAKDLTGAVKVVGNNIPAQGAAISAVDHFIVLPWLLYSGHAGLAVIAALPIWGPGYIAARYALPNFLMRQELIRIYGSRANYSAAKEGERALLEKFGMRGVTDLLVRNGDQAYAISPPLGTFGNAWKWLGLGSDRLDYATLKQALKQSGFDAKILAAFEQEKRIPDHYKAVLLLTLATNRADEKVRAALSQRFAKFLTKAERSGPVLTGLNEWVKGLVRARDYDEAVKRIRETPAKLPVKVVARIWEEALLPVLAQRIPGLPAHDLAGLQRQFSRLHAEANLATGANAEWSAAWQTKFENFLSEQASPAPAHCSKQAGALMK